MAAALMYHIRFHTVSKVWDLRSSAHQYHTEALLGRRAAFARTAPYDEDDENDEETLVCGIKE